jgi:hypothetical protein
MIPGPPPTGYNSWTEARQDSVQARADYMAQIMSQTQTQISFKLKDMKASFKTEVPINATGLMIPTMIDLGAT